MTVREIVVEYLRAHGYDGLWTNDCGDDGCGCLIDDLAPCCCESFFECEPGYKLPGNEDYDFLVGPKKEVQDENS